MMVWVGISSLGKTEIVFVRGKMNSESYQEILSNFLIPFLDRWPNLEIIFQQDNASVHASASTRQWLLDSSIETLPWPAKSPDLSPIENVWAMLVRDVYGNGKQYNTVSELKDGIRAVWDRLSQEKVAKLIESMNKRLVEVVSNKGGMTHY